MAGHPPKPGAPPLDAPPPYPGPPPGYDPTHPMPPPSAYPVPGPPMAHEQWVPGCPGGFPPGSYPHPGQPYPVTGGHPSLPGATTVVMTQPVTVVTMPSLGPYPVQMTCPHCEAQIMTATNTRAGLLTFLLCGVLIFFGCWFLCCLVPFCVPECQDIEHRCPNCKTHLGTYRRL